MPNGISARYQGKTHDGACVERVYFLICQIRWYRRSVRAFVLVEILGQKLFLCTQFAKEKCQPKLTDIRREEKKIFLTRLRTVA